MVENKDLEGSGGAVRGERELGGTLYSIAVQPEGRIAVVGSSTHGPQLIDAETTELARPGGSNGGARAVAFYDDDSILVAASGGELYAMSAVTGEVVKSFGSGGNPKGIAVGRAGGPSVLVLPPLII